MTADPGAALDLAIHVHPALPLWEHSLVAQLLPFWRRAGLRVTVVAGPAPAGPARIGLLHVDLTRVPLAYTALRSAYPVLLNGAVHDVSKRRLGSEVDVRPDDAYDGPVIVKTDLNAGGVPERIALRRAQPWPVRLAGAALDRLRPWRPTGARWARAVRYPVYPRKSAVPAWVWRRSDLVVQRFVPERAGDRYVFRFWYFLGSADHHVARLAPEPVLTRGARLEAELLGGVPGELRALRAAWGFDLGKFDYLMHEGRPVVLDVNKTPSLGLAGNPFHRAALPRLARGLDAWLDPARAAGDATAPGTDELSARARRRRAPGCTRPGAGQTP